MIGRPAPQHPYLDWEGVLGFAHRGGTGVHPENTLAAFRHAVSLGFTYLETDVHRTADGVLVAFHDEDLGRTCGRPGKITELQWSDVADARVGGSEPIPTLDELIETFPSARFNIDCKSDDAVDDLAATLSKHGVLDRVCVGAFSDRRLRRLRRLVGPALCTSLGPAETARLTIGLPAATGGQVAQVPVRSGPVQVVTASRVARAHRRGLQVHVWTIDDADEMHRLLGLGVDGIMTDRPEILRDVLVERGLW
ncbi:glycerophosphodiester phosphodiesterase [Ilumatobacteraceae bacterium]|nr:glycerophosphodiester phosphodiesterase [Ilumatobacteraceae bacterium]